MCDNEQVAIFWDYENCRPPSTSLGYGIVNRTLDIAHQYGSITTFKAYLDLNEPTPSKASSIYSELQSSGVSVIHCPHNGRKDVADKMIIVDMLAHGIDRPPPATIILISGDRDFSYAVSVMRLRKYRVIVITPAGNGHESLKYLASDVIDWSCIVSEAGATHSRNISSSGRLQAYPKARRDSVSTKPQAAMDVVEAAKSEALHGPMVDGIAAASLSTTPPPKVSLLIPSKISNSALALSGSSPHSSRDHECQDPCSQSSPTWSIEQSPPHTPRTGQSTLLPAQGSPTLVADSDEGGLAPELLRRMAPFELDLFRASERSFQSPLDNHLGSMPTRPKSCIEPIMSDSSSYWTARTGLTSQGQEEEEVGESGTSLIDNDGDNGAHRPDMATWVGAAEAQRPENDMNPSSPQAPNGTREEQDVDSYLSSTTSQIGFNHDFGSSAPPLMQHGGNLDVTTHLPYGATSAHNVSVPPAEYQRLIQVLQEYRANGVDRPLLSTIAYAMTHDKVTVLRLTDLSSFVTYVRLAETEGIVELGSLGPGFGIGWISLCPTWFEQPAFSSSIEDVAFHSQGSSTRMPFQGTFEGTPRSSANSITVPTPNPVSSGFESLVCIMRALRLQGYKRPVFRVVARAMGKDKNAILRAKGVSRLNEYAKLAHKAGIVEIGRAPGKGDWMSLLTVWHEKQTTATPSRS